jgi:hypothetical protein
MFVVERPTYRLTKTFYFVVFALVAMTGSFGLLLTMHVHYNPLRKRLDTLKGATEPRKNAHTKLDQSIPECDLPPLPDRQGPFQYKGHPYYLYPNGDVDGFTSRGWWRISFGDFMRYVGGATERKKKD